MGLSIVLLVIGWSLVDFTGTQPRASLLSASLLTLAVLLRAGACPLHPWMADLFEHATLGTALLFVAPMTGAYAVMHLVFPVAPAWAMQSIAVLSLTTAVYAAGMATIQTDARRFFCYLFLSHSSLVLSGLEIVTTIGLTGALCVWISVGLSLGGFGLTLRSMESRIGRITLNRYHGMYEHTPTLAGLFLLTGLASIGFPGTIGFIGMELLVEGAVDVYPLVGLAVVVAAALNSVAILRAYFRIFTGRKFETSVMLRSRPSERFAVTVLTILVLGGGLWPQPGVASRHHAADELMKLRRPPEHVVPPVIEPQEEEGEDEVISPESPKQHAKSQYRRETLTKIPAALGTQLQFQFVRGDP
jgi:NADH-quinone oxidoreductase subunit M